MENELHRMLPEGISLHIGRVLLMEGNEEGLLKMNEYASRAAQEIATADVDIILYGCTSGSFMKGEEFNQGLSRHLSENSGVRVITTATAVKNGLSALGLKSVCLVTPYPENRNVWAKTWLSSLGVTVVETIRLLPSNESQTVTNAEICRLLPELVYAGIKVYRFPKVDGLLLSCTNLRTIEIIEVLEEDFGVPVITSNQASLWAALREVGYRRPIQGYGRLLTAH